MVEEADKFKEDDQKIRDKIEAKNKLENYCFSMRSTMLNDDKMKSALGEDAETVDKTTQEALDWLDEMDDRSKEDYENKLKEVETKLSPLVQKAYSTNVKENNNQEPVQKTTNETQETQEEQQKESDIPDID